MRVEADTVFEALEQGIAEGAVQKRLTEENAFLYSVHPTIKDKIIRASKSGERESGRFDQGHFFKDN